MRSTPAFILAALLFGCGSSSAASPTMSQSDLADATQRARAACVAGTEKSCADLAMYLLKDPDPARQREGDALARKTCDAGIGNGCAVLTVVYSMGRAGHPADPEAAKALWERTCFASNGPLAFGCLVAGGDYLDGAHPDRARALALFEQACALRKAAGDAVEATQRTCATAQRLREEQPAKLP